MVWWSFHLEHGIKTCPKRVSPNAFFNFLRVRMPAAGVAGEVLPVNLNLQNFSFISRFLAFSGRRQAEYSSGKEKRPKIHEKAFITGT
jgi:hypothetical protein